ncbi:Crp/Fnr family transcriptional regulator [Listeria booriae]|uniref:Crp/Fnr family transcriptional regulator n=1 Tax=Listeria booriae TaxID=1552123 RepID=UPI001624CC40|nr:Crp/Fnr family transcriptional regulator [Listeria booriae]MBC2369824.1 Crp/Fnr family transcriptional regulator [Listeria booriae]
MPVFSELYDEKEIQSVFCESQLISFLTEKENIRHKRKEFKKGQYLNAGNHMENSKVYYIMEGIISVGNETDILYFIGPGHFVGLEHFMFNPQLPIEPKSLSSITLLEFEKEDILCLLVSLQEGWLYNYVINHNILIKLIVINKNLRLRPVARGVELAKELLPEFSKVESGITILSEVFTYTVLRKYLKIGYTAMEDVIEILEKENIYFGYRKHI